MPDDQFGLSLVECVCVCVCVSVSVIWSVNLAKLIGTCSEKPSIVAHGSHTLHPFFTPQIVRTYIYKYKSSS